LTHNPKVFRPRFPIRLLEPLEAGTSRDFQL
jgi:hypothetical protein